LILSQNRTFFLDLFWSKNETEDELVDFNEKRFDDEIEKKIIKRIVNDTKYPTGEIYWNVWVDRSFHRGIPVKYNFEGKIKLFITINCENCSPIQFKAIIDWTRETWNNPNIKIRQEDKTINRDE